MGSALSTAPGTSRWRRFVYHETTRDVVKEAVYALSVWGTSQTLRVVEGANEFEFLADADGATLREFYRNAERGDAVTIVREGGDLIFAGQVRGEPVDVRRSIGTIPWRASFFLLTSFIRSSDRETEFFIAIPSGKLASRLKATKQPRETIRLPGGAVETVPVVLTAPGIPAAVWSSRCWYRVPDGLLVRFVGRRGPPGTPQTVSELVREE